LKALIFPMLILRMLIFTEWKIGGCQIFHVRHIADSLRYQYQIVDNPVESISEIISKGIFDNSEKKKIELLRERVSGFASSAPEAMLIATEYEDIVEFDLFVKLMKEIEKSHGN